MWRLDNEAKSLGAREITKVERDDRLASSMYGRGPSMVPPAHLRKRRDAKGLRVHALVRQHADFDAHGASPAWTWSAGLRGWTRSP